MATERDIEAHLIGLEGKVMDKIPKEEEGIVRTLFFLVKCMLTDLHRIADAMEKRAKDG